MDSKRIAELRDIAKAYNFHGGKFILRSTFNECLDAIEEIDAAVAKAVEAEREAIIAEITGMTIGDGKIYMVAGIRRAGKTFGAAIDAVAEAIRARGKR